MGDIFQRHSHAGVTVLAGRFARRMAHMLVDVASDGEWT